MKVNPRDTAQRVIAKRITAPETRLDTDTGKKIAMLSYIDAGSYQKHIPTTKDLFLYGAGTNEEGEVPDGLDRLMNHRFIIHQNKSGKAIGIDVIPNRLYRSGVTPTSQEGVKTLTIRYDLGGAVARVVQWPFNTRFEQSAAVIQELDKLISAGKAITASMRLGNVGRVVNVTDNSVEVRLSAGRRRIQGEPIDDVEDVYDDLEEQADDAEESAPAPAVPVE